MTDPARHYISQPTKEQWDAIAERLDAMYAPVFLRCDGYLVRAELERTDKNRLQIVVGVNGYLFKGVWITSAINGDGVHQEPLRFWRPVKRQKMTAKELRLWERLIGKKKCKERGYYEPYIYRHNGWNRPRPFIAHLRQHNERIEVLDYETYAAELEALSSAEEKPDV